MGNIFSGLESLGLKGADHVEIYAQDEVQKKANQEEKQETVINEKSLLLVTSHIPMNQHFGVRALDAFQKKVSREGYRVEIEIVTEEEMRMNQVLQRDRFTEV